MNLRHTSQTVSILHARIVHEMRLTNLTISQQLSQMSCDFDLPRMWTRSMNALVKSYRSALERFERHRSGDVSETNQSFRAIKRERTDCSHRLRAVKKRKAFLHFQLQRRNLRALECRRRR
jgi:hypothetical protein